MNSCRVQRRETGGSGLTGQRDGIGFTYGTVIADGFDPPLLALEDVTDLRAFAADVAS